MPFHPIDIVNKIIPKSNSWDYQDIASRYQFKQDFNDLLATSNFEKDETIQLPVNRDIVARQWWASTIRYETNNAIKQQALAVEKKQKLKQEIGRLQIRTMQTTVDPVYGDVYNRLICQQGDTLGTKDLKTIDEQVCQEIYNSITDQDIINYLSESESKKQQQKLASDYNNGLFKLDNREQALNYACLLFELDKRKTEDNWGKPLQPLLVRGLQGEKINLASVICTINEFDYQGGYNLNPDLETYKTNSKVEPVPLIISEMASLVSLLKYYGINSDLVMFVADTDYTEIGANGPVTQNNLDNLDIYMANLNNYIQPLGPNITVAKISDITDNDPSYQQTKTNILRCVTARRDEDFNRLWGNKFEEDVERRNETFAKKKLCPPSLVRQESLRVAQNIWAVNAAQGVVISQLSDNLIFVSTERRERDVNYTLDKSAAKNFPPVIYVLNEAEKWNKKIVNKTIFEK